MAVTAAVSLMGNLILSPIHGLGRFTSFASQAFARCVVPPVNGRLLLKQLEFVGTRSIGIVLISSVMIGAVFALILGDIFRTFSAESMVGAAAGLALCKEMAPVLCGFLVTARAGSAMAAEIATMRVNEQIDAMRVMAVNPFSYLVAPRILGAVLMMPLLTSVFILVGVVSAVSVGVAFFDIDIGTCMEKLRWLVRPRFIFQGLEKAAVFGAFLAAIGCYKGFYAGGGAKGVGRATTAAVVISLVVILLVDFVLSYIQFEQLL